MPSDDSRSQPLPILHLYSRSRRVITVIVWVVLLLLLLNLLIAGGWQWDNVKWASWPLLIGWALYILQFQPEMRLDSRGVRMINVLTDIVIPWTAVTDVHVRLNTEVHVAGKKYYSWGAPGIRRRPKFVSNDPFRPRAQGAPKTMAPDPTQAEISEYQNEYQPLQPTTGRESVTVRWAWWKSLITAALVVFCLLSIFA